MTRLPSFPSGNPGRGVRGGGGSGKAQGNEGRSQRWSAGGVEARGGRRPGPEMGGREDPKMVKELGFLQGRPLQAREERAAGQRLGGPGQGSSTPQNPRSTDMAQESGPLPPAAAFHQKSCEGPSRGHAPRPALRTSPRFPRLFARSRRLAGGGHRAQDRCPRGSLLMSWALPAAVGKHRLHPARA